MADLTHTTTLTWSGTGGATFGGSLSDTADAEDNRNVTISSSVEVEVDLAISATRLKHLFMLSDGALTIRTNQGTTGTPQDVIALTANSPSSYSASSGTTGPFAGDVTAFFVTTTGAGPTLLRVRVLQDSTP